MLNHLFVNYRIAKLLQEYGMVVPCMAIIYPDNELVIGSVSYVTILNRMDNSRLKCPTYAQVVDWLREKHGLVVDVFQQFDEDKKCYTGMWQIDVSKLGKYEDPHQIIVTEVYDNYYTALKKAITETVSHI